MLFVWNITGETIALSHHVFYQYYRAHKQTPRIPPFYREQTSQWAPILRLQTTRRLHPHFAAMISVVLSVHLFIIALLIKTSLCRRVLRYSKTPLSTLRSIGSLTSLFPRQPKWFIIMKFTPNQAAGANSTTEFARFFTIVAMKWYCVWKEDSCLNCFRSSLPSCS